ncbi:unnamed protein product [Closterium sp. Yama58-4]|nr:unnamed protein product [Closterium sp. Yama58-4]
MAKKAGGERGGLEKERAAVEGVWEPGGGGNSTGGNSRGAKEANFLPISSIPPFLSSSLPAASLPFLPIRLAAIPSRPPLGLHQAFYSSYSPNSSPFPPLSPSTLSTPPNQSPLSSHQARCNSFKTPSGPSPSLLPAYFLYSPPFSPPLSLLPVSPFFPSGSLQFLQDPLWAFSKPVAAIPFTPTTPPPPFPPPLPLHPFSPNQSFCSSYSPNSPLSRPSSPLLYQHRPISFPILLLALTAFSKTPVGLHQAFYCYFVYNRTPPSPPISPPPVSPFFPSGSLQFLQDPLWAFTQPTLIPSTSPLPPHLRLLHSISPPPVSPFFPSGSLQFLQDPLWAFTKSSPAAPPPSTVNELSPEQLLQFDSEALEKHLQAVPLPSLLMLSPHDRATFFPDEEHRHVKEHALAGEGDLDELLGGETGSSSSATRGEVNMAEKQHIGQQARAGAAGATVPVHGIGLAGENDLDKLLGGQSQSSREAAKRGVKAGDSFGVASAAAAAALVKPDPKPAAATAAAAHAPALDDFDELLGGQSQSSSNAAKGGVNVGYSFGVASAGAPAQAKPEPRPAAAQAPALDDFDEWFDSVT